MMPGCSPFRFSLYGLLPSSDPLSLSSTTGAARMHTDTMITTRRAMGAERPTRMETAATLGESLTSAVEFFFFLHFPLLCSCSSCEIWDFCLVCVIA
jgi:hypothetical protein